VSETLITVLEDVLVQGDRAIPRHITLYKGLATEFRSVILSTLEREEAMRLLRLYGVRYDILLTKDDSILSDVAWKVHAVRECLGVGWRIGFFLDCDPSAVREIFAMGVSSLLLTHHMLRPAWLPSDGPPREWEALVAFQEAQDERSADRASGRLERLERVDVYEVGGR